MANENIRVSARNKGVRFWMIADVLGISEASFTRKMRRELPEDEQQRIMRIIDEIRSRRR